MKYKVLLSFLLIAIITQAQKGKVYQLVSPNKKITVAVETGSKTFWLVKHDNTQVLSPSPISLTLSDGEVLGQNVSVSNTKTSSVNTSFITPFYKKSSVKDEYNQLVINYKGNYGLIFRAYNDGVAYRFFTNRNAEQTITGEEASFTFDQDYKTFIPFAWDPRLKGDLFQTSFEALYNEIKISEVKKDTVAFLPILIDLGNNKKAVILEADLENFPGMYLAGNSDAKNSFKSVYAPYPTEEKQGGHNMFNYVVTKRADYIAKVPGKSNFPWRAVVISESDKELANNDMIQKLASPNRINDISWIKPGKVAWDWWNDWNITGVDFKAGINTPTYKYYIDFAAANKLEYIVLDEGWSDPSDLMKISPRINLQEIIDYGKEKGVGVILWATWYAVNAKMNEAFAAYSKMGAKGFKMDFLDRDDQKMVASTYEIAKKAAEHKLLVDYHGMFKPAGLQRTYPNVINFEGVKGMENAKWAPRDDVPRYDVTIPFIRMMAGPMDYTPGAMRNATRSTFRAIGSMPMSQGTRCHQLAMYTIFEAPLQMLADNPTAYMKEKESTDFIAKIPTTFDETVVLDGKLGEHIAIARRKGDIWYIGAMSNWTPKELELDFSFLGDGTYEAEVFRDGMNAERNATDYKREMLQLSAKDKVKVNFAPGGGWAARLIKK